MNMNKIMFCFAAVIYSGIFFISCSEDDVDEKSCDITTETYTNSSQGIVVYSVTGTGNYTVKSLVYGDTSGQVTVNNPSLPYEDTINVPDGTNISIGITGKTKDGMLTVKHTFTSFTESETNSVDCGNSSNTENYIHLQQ